MTPQTNNDIVYATRAFIGWPKWNKYPNHATGACRLTWSSNPRKQPPWHVHKVPPQRFCWLFREMWANFINTFSSLSDRSWTQPSCAALSQRCWFIRPLWVDRFVTFIMFFSSRFAGKLFMPPFLTMSLFVWVNKIVQNLHRKEIPVCHKTLMR